MLCLLNYEQLVELLLRTSDFTSALENHKGYFNDDVLGWLNALESELRQNRLPEAAQVAALRLRVLAAARGASDEPSSASRSRRKRTMAVASNAVSRAVELVTEALTPDRQRFREVEEVVLQLAAHILSNGIQLDTLGADGAERMSQLIALLKRNGNAQTVIQLEGRVGAVDLMMMMDRALHRLQREGVRST